MRRLAGALPLIVLWAAPLVLSLAAALWSGLDPASWQALFDHPQLWSGLWLSLFIASVATAVALIAALVILSALHGTRAWRALQPIAAAGLALPHLAFAVGFAFLIMPSGLAARLLVGGDQPPQWLTVQDPWGLALAAALALKEIPFLLMLGWSALARGEFALSLEGQMRAARSLGHGDGSIWLRIVVPQLLRQLRWPLAIVFVYGASVVDMALVLGPTQPPPLAPTLWRDLNDADPMTNGRGLAGAILISVALAAALGLFSAVAWGARQGLRVFLSAGPSSLASPRIAGAALAVGLLVVHALAGAALAVLSFADRWPYPGLWPAASSARAWAILLAGAETLWLSLGFAAASAVTAVALTVAWFETQPQAFDRCLIGSAVTALALPPLLLASGLYRLLLGLGWEGSLAGLFLAHLGPVMAYAAVVLAGPYRGFDQRFIQSAHGLSVPPWRSFIAIKLPLLKAPLLAALAIGFAVSMVQFVAPQLVAAGRMSTLPMEAVTLASGGDRALASAHALALALPPLIVFALAGIFGRPRWR